MNVFITLHSKHGKIFKGGPKIVSFTAVMHGGLCVCVCDGLAFVSEM